MSKENMIKALKCIASQDAEGDCYADRYNAHLICDQHDKKIRLDEKAMTCGGRTGNTINCPYHQNEYGVCFEDGELYWLKEVAEMITRESEAE